MGASSSKEKKSTSKKRGSNANINSISAVNDDGYSASKKCKRNKKKSPKQENAKLKKKTKEHSDCDQAKHGNCDKKQCSKSISFEPKAKCGLEVSSQVYRKKSACPSCEAGDMLLDQLRSRSGSDKALRYSDFNRVRRQSRVDNLDMGPIEIPLDGVEEPVPQTLCFICGVYTGSVTRTCRVCYHVYHNGCLQKIRHGLDSKTVHLAQLGLWACHQCSDISRLLTREETHAVSEWLKAMDIDQDGLMEADYVVYKAKMFEALGKTVTPEKRSAWINGFRCATKSKNQPVLDWSQFLELEAVSILQNRCKDSLVHLLTDSEFALARKMYKEINPSGQVTVADVRNSIVNLYNRYNNNDHNDGEIVEEEEEKDVNRCVAWSDFLRLLAVHMLSVRKNCECLATMDRNCDETKSFESHDDEAYRTCESDADKIELSAEQTLDDSKDADKSLSMLDDLSKAFNLNCGASSENNHECSDKKSSDIKENVSEVADDSTKKNHLWQNRPYLRQHPHFTTVTDEPETRPSAPEKIVNRRSEILVRPSTEEGRSPRRAVSQKLVPPAYGLVGKIQESGWVC